MASAFLTSRVAGSLGIAALALLLAGGVWWLRRIVSRRLRSSESESLKRRAAIRFLDDIYVVALLMILVGALYLALANLSLWDATAQRPAGWFGAVALGLALIAVVRMARSVVHVITEQLEQRIETPEQLRMLQSIVPQVQRACTGAIVVVGALVILEQVGVSVAPLLAGLGIGGIAVAFAAQNTLANLLAGLSIFIDGTVRVGDMVELDSGQRGFVEDVGWRTTKL
ncbi:MAG: mechanosensitive ion channel, partial [Chloroflexota bacterium]|nr:mechanosensitive ion channel [Chloroflexota bacterium]